MTLKLDMSVAAFSGFLLEAYGIEEWLKLSASPLACGSRQTYLPTYLPAAAGGRKNLPTYLPTRRFHDKKNTGRTMTRRTNTNGSWLPITGWRATGTPTGQLNQL